MALEAGQLYLPTQHTSTQTSFKILLISSSTFFSSFIHYYAFIFLPIKEETLLMEVREGGKKGCGVGGVNTYISIT